MEPLSEIAQAIADAAAAGAAKGAGQIASKAVQDAYAALKERLLLALGKQSEAADAIIGVERKPASPGRQATLREELSEAGPNAAHREIVQLAKELRDLLARQGRSGDSYRASLKGPGAIAQGSESVAGGAGSTISVVRNVYQGPATADPERALEIYRRVLGRTTQHFSLSKIDEVASDPTSDSAQPLDLVQVYVHLDTTTPRSEEGIERVPRGRAKPESRPKHWTALEAVATSPCIVLLGDPGGGKSTFVNHLAHCLALAPLSEDPQWLSRRLPDWPENDRDRLPVVVSLRGFSASLPDPLPEASAGELFAFIARRLKQQKLEFALPAIEQALEDGKALVLLDGLDEVSSETQRAFVRDCLHEFSQQRYPGNRFLATCRILSYQPPSARGRPDLRLHDFRPFELAPFDEERIALFIQAWYAEISRLDPTGFPDAESGAAELQTAVRREELGRLAPNPLLLTVMAVVHTHKGRLPEARALLYEEMIDILLWRWEKKKGEGDAKEPLLRRLLQEAGRSPVDLKRTLWKLAYEAHSGESSQEGEKGAGIGELTLQKSLAALHSGDIAWAYQVIEAIRLRAGLLLEREPGMFTFPHRTFQEHLAGAHLASLNDFAPEVSKLAESGDLWRVVVLLAVGKLVHVSGDLDRPLSLVSELCPKQPGKDPQAWNKVWLAGEVLSEMGNHRAKDRELGRELSTRVRDRLAQLVTTGRLTPQNRCLAGDVWPGWGIPVAR